MHRVVPLSPPVAIPAVPALSDPALATLRDQFWRSADDCQSTLFIKYASALEARIASGATTFGRELYYAADELDLPIYATRTKQSHMAFASPAVSVELLLVWLHMARSFQRHTMKRAESIPMGSAGNPPRDDIRQAFGVLRSYAWAATWAVDEAIALYSASILLDAQASVDADVMGYDQEALQRIRKETACAALEVEYYGRIYSAAGTPFSVADRVGRAIALHALYEEMRDDPALDDTMRHVFEISECVWSDVAYRAAMRSVAVHWNNHESISMAAMTDGSKVRRAAAMFSRACRDCEDSVNIINTHAKVLPRSIVSVFGPTQQKRLENSKLRISTIATALRLSVESASIGPDAAPAFDVIVRDLQCNATSDTSVPPDAVTHVAKYRAQLQVRERQHYVAATETPIDPLMQPTEEITELVEAGKQHYAVQPPAPRLAVPPTTSFSPLNDLLTRVWDAARNAPAFGDPFERGVAVGILMERIATDPSTRAETDAALAELFDAM